MRQALVADTGGLLRALASRRDGAPAWSAYAAALTSAAAVIGPALVLSEVDYFLRLERPAMRRFIAEVLDPATTYELEPVIPTEHPGSAIRHPRSLRLNPPVVAP